MEKEKEEKSINWLLIILNIIIGAIILLAINIIYFVDQVYAASTMYTYLNNGTIITQCNNTTICHDMTLNQQMSGAYTFKENISIPNNTDLVIRIKYKTSYRYHGIIINEENPYIYIHGTIDQDLTPICTINGTQTNDEDTIYKYKYYTYDITCTLSIQSTDAYELGVAKSISLTEDTGSNSFKLRIEELEYNVSTSPNTSGIENAIQSGNANIINNQNSNTNEIIGNQDKNTQEIIDNQNANSQAQIEAIENQNKKCENRNLNLSDEVGIEQQALTSNGGLTSSTGYNISKYIPVNEGKTQVYTRSWTSNAYYCLYGEDKTLIQCVQYGSNNLTINITPQVDGYIRFTLRRQSTATQTLSGEYCYNMLEGKPYDKRPVDTQKEQDYLESEQELLDLYNSDQLDIVDISIDTNGSTWVWDRITQYLNTNELIRLMVISILSLGVIKLVLSR